MGSFSTSTDASTGLPVYLWVVIVGVAVIAIYVIWRFVIKKGKTGSNVADAMQSPASTSENLASPINQAPEPPAPEVVNQASTDIPVEPANPTAPQAPTKPPVENQTPQNPV